MKVWPIPPSDESNLSAEAFTQALTLGELRSVPRGQDVDEGRNVGIGVILAGLKQNLQVHRSNITLPENCVHLHWRIHICYISSF